MKGMLPGNGIKNIREVTNYLYTIIGKELTNITSPCYKPRMLLYEKDIQAKLGITNEQLKIFKNSLDKKYSKFQVFSDRYTLMLIYGVIYFLQNNFVEIAENIYKVLAIKFYSSLNFKYFKICQPKIFSDALEQLSDKHLFKIKNGISPAISYIAGEEFKKIKYQFSKEYIPDSAILNTVVLLRSRLNQSMKSLSIMYYKIFSLKDESMSKQVEDDQTSNALVAEKISTLISTYSQVDKSALERSISISGINKQIAYAIVTNLSQPNTKEDINFLIILLGRLDNLKNVCKETSRLNIIRKIVNKTTIMNKYSPYEQLKKIIDNMGEYQLKTVSILVSITFLSNYLTLYMANRIC